MISDALVLIPGAGATCLHAAAKLPVICMVRDPCHPGRADEIRRRGSLTPDLRGKIHRTNKSLFNRRGVP